MKNELNLKLFIMSFLYILFHFGLIIVVIDYLVQIYCRISSHHFLC